MRCELPSLDVETRRTSTFHIIQEWILGRRAPAFVVAREEELEEYMVEEAEWKAAEWGCSFLEDAAGATEHQSGSLYVTLSINPRNSKKIEQSFRSQMEQCDDFTNRIALSILLKLG